MTSPSRLTRTACTLRRPIFTPMENAPVGFGATGVDGWPTCPRTFFSFIKRLSLNSALTMTEAAWPLSPVWRASSAFDMGPISRSLLMINRSLYARKRLVSPPRTSTRPPSPSRIKSTLIYRLDDSPTFQHFQHKINIKSFSLKKILARNFHFTADTWRLAF